VESKSETGPYCSFCGKASGDVAKMIAGPGVFVCSECVELCNATLADKTARPEPRLPYWESMTDEQILELIPKIAAVSDQVDGSLRERINDLRARGVSWARIGSALGVARQSAWERFSAEERQPAAEG
jgi:hypothetical protein